MTYHGLDVLDAPFHNLRDAIAVAFERAGELHDNPLGRRAYHDHAGQALPVREFTWTCRDRAGCDALRAFLDARLGRLVPFWLPTSIRDLTLVQDAAADAGSLVVADSGYGRLLYPRTARRDLALFVHGRGLVLRRVVGVTAGDSGTEVLALDTPAGVALTARRSLVSFLVLCRLADDLTTIDWWSRTTCEAKLRFVELPREVPA